MPVATTHGREELPTWQNLGLGAFLSMASREAKSLGLVLMAESTVTPVPTPSTKVPMSSAALRPWGIQEMPKGSRFLRTSVDFVCVCVDGWKDLVRLSSLRSCGVPTHTHHHPHIPSKQG